MNTTIVLLGIGVVASLFFRTSLAFRITLAVIFIWILLLRYLAGLGACLTFLAIGVFLLYGAFAALRRGSIGINARTRFVVYGRRNNPIEFWFYVPFFTIMGLLACGVAVYITLHFPIFHLEL